MIDSAGIYKKANSLVQFHGTRDPILISKASGIDVIPVDYFNDLLGMIRLRLRGRLCRAADDIFREHSVSAAPQGGEGHQEHERQGKYASPGSGSILTHTAFLSFNTRGI